MPKINKKKKIQPKILNLSKYSLSLSAISLLSKGPKFCPTTKGNYFTMKSDTKTFNRKLKLMERFKDIQYEDESIVRMKSSYEPFCTNTELNKIINDLENTDPIYTNLTDNLTTEERKSLNELKENTNIVIKKADKVSTFVIMDKDYYKEKLVLKDHLSTNSYTKVDSLTDEKTHKQLINLVKEHESCLTKSESKFLTESNWKSSKFYVTPKIHKCKEIIEKCNKADSIYVEMKPPTDLKGRPIVSSVNAPTKNISILFEKLLNPTVNKLKSYIKDDWDFHVFQQSN